MNVFEAIDFLDKQVANPSLGLPEEIFLFLSRMTPMVNVDLLIKDDKGQTLLTWRDDKHWQPGWHIPGGIIRYKEKIADRIQAVAKGELGAKVNFNPTPLAMNECIIKSKKDRGHFISLLYQCELLTPLNVPKPGQWIWHKGCPDNIIEIHKMYRKYI